MKRLDSKFLLVLPSIVLASLFLSGCKSTASQDNRTWTHLVCSGSSSDWTQCWKEAKQLCPNGKFDIANKQEQRESLKREVDIACK